MAEEVTTADLTVRISVAQLLWFAGLAISGWLLAGRIRAAALIPAAVGLAALWAVA